MVDLDPRFKQRLILGNYLCESMNVDPNEVLDDWWLERKFGGLVWTYNLVARNEDGTIKAVNGKPLTAEQRVVLPLEIATSVLNFSQ